MSIKNNFEYLFEILEGLKLKNTTIDAYNGQFANGLDKIFSRTQAVYLDYSDSTSEPITENNYHKTKDRFLIYIAVASKSKKAIEVKREVIELIDTVRDGLDGNNEFAIKTTKRVSSMPRLEIYTIIIEFGE